MTHDRSSRIGLTSWFILSKRPGNDRETPRPYLSYVVWLETATPAASAPGQERPKC